MTLIGSVPARTSGALGSSIRILKGNSSTTATPILSTHVYNTRRGCRFARGQSFAKSSGNISSIFTHQLAGYIA